MSLNEKLDFSKDMVVTVSVNIENGDKVSVKRVITKDIFESKDYTHQEIIRDQIVAGAMQCHNLLNINEAKLKLALTDTRKVNEWLENVTKERFQDWNASFYYSDSDQSFHASTYWVNMKLPDRQKFAWINNSERKEKIRVGPINYRVAVITPDDRVVYNGANYLDIKEPILHKEFPYTVKEIRDFFKTLPFPIEINTENMISYDEARQYASDEDVVYYGDDQDQQDEW